MAAQRAIYAVEEDKNLITDAVAEGAGASHWDERDSTSLKALLEGRVQAGHPTSTMIMAGACRISRPSRRPCCPAIYSGAKDSLPAMQVSALCVLLLCVLPVHECWVLSVSSRGFPGYRTQLPTAVLSIR